MSKAARRKVAAVAGDLFRGYPKSRAPLREKQDDLFAVESTADVVNAAPAKRGEWEKLRDENDSLRSQNRRLNQTVQAQHSGQLRLICLLLDLGMTPDKLTAWQRQLDYIEALERDKDEPRVKALARSEGQNAN